MTAQLLDADAGTEPRSSRTWPALGRTVLPVALIALWTWLNTWWSLTRLDARALNIDEAGYLSMAANHAYGFAAQGPSGWWTSVLAPSQHAPGVPVATSVLVAAGLDVTVAGLVLVGLSGGVMLLFTWLLARELGSAVGWLALVVLATAPGLLNYSHIYTFVVPTAALLAVALYAVHRVHRADALGWWVVLGVALGLLPAVRSMNLVFAGILGVVVQSRALLVTEGRWRALGRVGLAALLAVVVLLPWMWSSWRLVLGYLLGFGYGDRAAEYSAKGGSTLAAVQVTAAELYAVHTAFVLVGLVLVVLVAAAATWGRSRTPGGWRAVPGPVVASPVYPAVVLTVLGYAALGTTSNAGSGFGLQLAPAVVTAACFGWGRLLALPAPSVRRLVVPAVAGVVAVACASPAAGLVTRVAPFGTDRVTSLPVVGGVRLTGGEGLDESYLKVVGQDEGVVNEADWADDWREVSDALAEEVVDDDLVASSIAFGFRGYFVNVNTVQLEVLRDGHWAVPLVQIEPAVVDATQDAYHEWLTTGAAATVCHLATSPGDVNEFQPGVDTARMEAAAVAADFARTESFRTPDGRTVDLWERDDPACR